MDFTRRDFLKTAAAGTVVGALSPSLLGKGSASKRPPNIVMFITDQQFAGAMSCAGNKYVDTPNMDMLAEAGVRFENAYVNLPVCLPQRYTLFTGRLPCTRRNADPDNKPTVSVGNILKAAGYKTHYYGKWHIQDKTFTREDVKYSGFDVNEGGKDKSTAMNAQKLFKEIDASSPFAAVFSFYNPHDICEWGRKKSGVKKRIKMRNGEVSVNPPLAECPPLPANFKINEDEAAAVTARRAGPNAQSMAMKWDNNTWRQYLWGYYRLVELADKRIGECITALKTNGLWDNTLVIFTSDHGEGCAGHRWHQKSILYEESVRVPLIMSWPGRIRKNETDEHLTSAGIDFMATIADACRQPMPKGPYYGKSVLPFALDKNAKAPTHTYVVSESTVEKIDEKAKEKTTYQGRSLRSRRFKYHVWNQGKNREQLFDLEKDPGETTNLAQKKEYAASMEEHRAYFKEWLKNTDDTYKVI